MNDSGFRRLALAAGFVALAATGAAGQEAPGHQHAHGAPAQAYGARYPHTEADVHFMSGMIPHHAQAIAMASLAPDRAAAPSVRVLAERIINGQRDEIATMQQWLADRGQPVPEARPTGMKMTMNGVEHEMLMPGMLSEAQMMELEKAAGPVFDRLFLTYMIQHHRGAVSMAKDLFGSPGAAQDEGVFKLASDVNVDQATEIARMERMLASLIFVDLPQGQDRP